jgi:hypothetical protein
LTPLTTPLPATVVVTPALVTAPLVAVPPPMATPQALLGLTGLLLLQVPLVTFPSPVADWFTGPLVTAFRLLPEVFVPPVPPLPPLTLTDEVDEPVALIVAVAPVTLEFPPRLMVSPLARPVGLPPLADDLVLPVMPVEPDWLFDTLTVVLLPVACVVWLAPWVFCVTFALELLLPVALLVDVDGRLAFFLSPSSLSSLSRFSLSRFSLSRSSLSWFELDWYELLLVVVALLLLLRSGALMTVTGRINASSSADPSRPTTVLRRTRPEVFAPELLDID